MSDQMQIEEVFVIQSEAVDFFAALIKGEKGKSLVQGKVRLEGGRRWFFNYPAERRDVVRKKLLDFCEAIAGCYGTDVFCQKFERAIDCGTFVEILRSAKGSLN